MLVEAFTDVSVFSIWFPLISICDGKFIILLPVIIDFIRDHVLCVTFIKEVKIICLFSLFSRFFMLVPKCYLVLLVNVSGILGKSYVNHIFDVETFGDIWSSPILFRYVGFWWFLYEWKVEIIVHQKYLWEADVDIYGIVLIIVQRPFSFDDLLMKLFMLAFVRSHRTIACLNLLLGLLLSTFLLMLL